MRCGFILPEFSCETPFEVRTNGLPVCYTVNNRKTYHTTHKTPIFPHTCGKQPRISCANDLLKEGVKMLLLYIILAPFVFLAELLKLTK